MTSLPSECQEPDCPVPVKARGWCLRHYMRERRQGLSALPAATLADRFWDKVIKTETCWLWTGAMNGSGYGRLFVDGQMVPSHRVAYEMMSGPIPDGLFVDHLCRNRACVNPSHLEPVTNAENILRGTSPSALYARRTHCKNGHEYTPENTGPNSKGGRRCRACEREWSRIRRSS